MKSYIPTINISSLLKSEFESKSAINTLKKIEKACVEVLNWPSPVKTKNKILIIVAPKYKCIIWVYELSLSDVYFVIVIDIE